MTHPFTELGLAEPLVRAIADLNYTEPTPVQKQALPFVLAGRDLLAAAQTGTGKTAAYSLPIIQALAKNPLERTTGLPRALILAPTRELAAQIYENIVAYSKNVDVRAALMFGGVSIKPQITALKKGVDILVATPGRLLDHIGQKTLSLSAVQHFVLDEADRMLDMGFIHDIRKILKLIPEKRQTLLFSATFSPEIRKLADSMLTEPASVEISPNKESALIEQKAYAIPKNRKRELLRDLIVDGQWEQVLVFTRMKHAANRLSQQMMRDGIEAAAIHGNKSQNARTKALADFKAKKVRVLVATDIAARGLDIEQLPHVVNYDLPDVPEDYVHRIGRTGRAGTPGHAVSLVSPDDKPLLAAIEKLLKEKIELIKPEGYDGPQPDDLAAEDKQADLNRRAELSAMREARRNAAAKRRGQKKTADAADKNAAETPAATVKQAVADAVKEETAEEKRPFDPASDRDTSAPGRRAASRRGRPSGDRNQKRSGSRPSDRQPSSDRRRFARTPDREQFDPDNFGNSIHYQPKKPASASRRARRDGGIERYEPVDPFAPEHQALTLPQHMPDERPRGSRQGFRRSDRQESEGYASRGRRGYGKPRSARSTDYFEQNSRYSDSYTRSNLPPGLAPRKNRTRNR